MHEYNEHIERALRRRGWRIHLYYDDARRHFVATTMGERPLYSAPGRTPEEALRTLMSVIRSNVMREVLKEIRKEQ